MKSGQDDTPPPLARPPLKPPPVPIALPEHEPAALPVLQGRADLLLQIHELEGALQYVGGLHPGRAAMHHRLAALKDLLTRWDQMLALRQARRGAP